MMKIHTLMISTHGNRLTSSDVQSSRLFTYSTGTTSFGTRLGGIQVTSRKASTDPIVN